MACSSSGPAQWWRRSLRLADLPALLALGLAERLHGLQQEAPVALATVLARREALLRLVDPVALGDFHWLAYGRGGTPELPRFSREPTC